MLGSRIKELRKENLMTQTELAEKLGVGRSTITEYERDAVSPPLDKIKLMTKIFDVSIEYLTGFTNSRVTLTESKDDLGVCLSQLITQLDEKSVFYKFNGKIMDDRMKQLLKSQLKSTIDLIDYLTTLDHLE